MSRQRFSSYLVIEKWSVEDVEQFLEKNGFGECCGAFKKRAIDGHAFLGLTEGHLMLWKRELSMINIRKLSKLIQELSQQPEKYISSDFMKNGTITPAVKTNQFSTFKPQTSNPSSLQLPRGTLVSLKNATGDVASIVSNMEFCSRPSVTNTNSSCSNGLLAKNCNLHVKQTAFQQNHNSETSSSCSDNCSWDTNFSDDDVPSYLTTSDTELQCNHTNKLATSISISEKADVILSQLNQQEIPKPPVSSYSDFYPRRNTCETNGITSPRPANQELQKQQVPQLSDVSPSRSAMPGEPPPIQIVRKLPAPPIQQLQNPLHLKELASRLNISAAVEKAFSEQWDEEEQYESIDNENLPSREAIAAFTQKSSSQLSLNSQKSPSQLSLNSQKSPSQLSLNSPQDLTEEKSILSSPCSQNKLQNGWSQQFERRMSSQTESPQLLERTSTATTGHQPPVPPLSKRPPPALPITSRPLPPQPVSSPSVSRSSSFAYRQSSSMADQEEEQYESVDGHAPQHADDGNLSDEYESIRDNTKQVVCGAPQAGDADYYLQPLAKQNSCEPAHPTLPPKPAVSIEIPSLEPPSPPVRLSEDLGNTSSTSPGNSGDGVSGLIGELLRKVRNKPSSTTSTLEKEKTPTAEVKKPQLLPPPEHKPPPPVERPLAYQNNQRPLPPTPESSKLSLSTKEQSNTVNRRGSRSTAITQMPWYHNVDRKKADELVRNSQDGTFLLRPSSQTQNPLSLTLWYNNRIYNISVRHRPDGKYALGYEKPNEQSFTSIEELVANYQSENLVLYSNGERTGRTLLTGWPPRRE